MTEKNELIAKGIIAVGFIIFIAFILVMLSLPKWDNNTNIEAYQIEETTSYQPYAYGYGTGSNGGGNTFYNILAVMLVSIGCILGVIYYEKTRYNTST